MNASRSDKYYFPRGDLVILVEHILFRVHQDILERHSGFFEALFASPSNDDTVGRSDERPLRLPRDLSTAQAFTTICKFLYPPLVGALPNVTIKDLDVWEPVLDATLALQFTGIQDYISRGLCNDKKNIHLFTSRLFNIADRIGDEDLKWECYYEFFYRVRPLSLDDGRILGASHLALITHACVGNFSSSRFISV
ncbi:hypothetical protein BDV93DRAFT_78736 [Ceratobasidium sp. AG-I]|nr:hypothetical protein BDV93DRAFT_78736 [Ceratobasidium sp. AG-I]